DHGLPFEDSLSPRDIGLPDSRIVDWQRVLLNLALGAGQFNPLARQIHDREFHRIADVDGKVDIACAFAVIAHAGIGGWSGIRVQEESHDSVDEVADIAEGPRLTSVSVDAQR